MAFQPHIEVGKVKLVAACDIDDIVAAKMAKEYEMDAHYTRWEDLLRRNDIDAVSICLPHNTGQERL